MYWNSVSESKTIHTLLYFLPPSSSNPSLLHKRTKSSPCLMLANPPTLSQLLLVSIPPLYAMPSPSSPLEGQKMLSRSPNPSPTSSITLSPHHSSSSPQKSWYEGCGQG